MASARQRYRARCRALEFLFGLDFTEGEAEPALAAFWDTFDTPEPSREYATVLIRGILAERAALDAEIDAALTQWTPDRVGVIERNLLRIALYEMRHVPEVPYRVAIDEAVELAKAYGGEDAPGFVNAVLDRLAASLA